MIRVINFLPNDYVERRGRRRANVACLLIAVAGLLILGGVVGFLFTRSIGVAFMRQVVDQQYAEASKQIDQLKQLEERKAGLVHKVELSTALLERVPRSHLLARLANYLPPGTSLMVLTMKAEDVDMKVEPPTEAADKDAAPGQAKSKAAPAAAKSRSSKKGKVETVKVRRYAFRADGLAPTDMEVAELLGRLSADPIFDDVNLQFSEDFPYQENVRMRRFQVGFRLSGQAEKLLDADPASGSTAAAPAPAPARGDS